MPTTAVPAHLLPTACYVCGGQPHPTTPLHAYWSNAQAAVDLAEPQTAYSPEAAYVAQHRPY